MKHLPKILLVYPPLGFISSFVKYVPLSLIYVAVDVVKSGFNVELIDFRGHKESLESLLRQKLTEDVVLVGISVMTGEPVRGAVQLSKIVRKYSNAKIVWGGPHPTILPEEVLKQEYVDFVVRGWGSKALDALMHKIVSGENNYGDVPGLCYKEEEIFHIAEINACYECYDYKKIPYHLIDNHLEKYFQGAKREFPIYTAWGCPYNCAFCIAPILYKANRKKWVPFNTENVVDHMQFLVDKYNINFFYLFDDDSFVNPRHVINIAKEIKKRGLNIELGVRGIRVDEIKRMTDEDLRLLEEIGMTNLHIGVESGSQRMLDLMKKGIRVADSIEINRRLARFPNFLPMYNFLVGFPTETIEDLKDTKKLMIQLAQDNPRCLLFGPAKFVPYPGGELFDLAVKYGFKLPENIEDWAEIDQEKEIWMPWYTKEYNQYINMLYVEQNILDNRFNLIPHFGRFMVLLFKFIKLLYTPIGKFRLRYDFSKFLVEYKVMKYFY